MTLPQRLASHKLRAKHLFGIARPLATQLETTASTQSSATRRRHAQHLLAPPLTQSSK